MMKEYLLFHMTALAAGILADAFIGDPHCLPHPIRAIGRLINRLESMLYKEGKGDTQIKRGAVLFVIVVLSTACISFAVMFVSYRLSVYFGAAVEAVLTFYIMAAGSLRKESMKVCNALKSGDIDDARAALSMIVGRDTDELDEAAIARAGVETVAENTSDGVIAPLLFTALFGPVGGFFYKAVNTMDSMIGYRNARYECFGRTAAIADDIANFIPARISALFMIAASFVMPASVYDGKRAARIWARDRYEHKSPNSAQTESVCAGALGVRLGGDSKYGGVIVKKPFIGDDHRPICADDISRAVTLMYVTEILCTAVIFTIMMLRSISL